MPDICPKKVPDDFFLFFLCDDGGIPSACDDNFVAPHFHRDFDHPFFRNPISSPVFRRHSKWRMEIQMVHHTLESWKHQGHQSNMTKTWQKNRTYFESRKMKLAKHLCFFCHVFLSFSCHFLVIVSLFFNHFFHFLALKQQNHWQINQNRRKNRENIWHNRRKPMKTWRKPTQKKEKQAKREETHGKVTKNNKKWRIVKEKINKNKRIRKKNS